MRAPVLPTFLPPPRQRSYTELGVSALLHAALILAILSPWFRRYHVLSPNGTGLPGLGGGGGAAGEQYIALPALRSAATPPAAPVEAVVETPPVQPPTTVPTEIPPPTPDTVTASPTQASEASGGATSGSTTGTGGGGGGSGGGQGPGSGSGTGPGGGGGSRGIPPELRGFPIPPTDGTPRELRNKPLTIICYVGLDGRVERFELIPEITDRNYRRTVADLIAGYRFKPARDSTGMIVRGVAPVTWNLPNR